MQSECCLNIICKSIRVAMMGIEHYLKVFSRREKERHPVTLLTEANPLDL